MEPGDLAAERGDSDRVLEQAARVAVVTVGDRRKRPQAPAQVPVLEEAADERMEPPVGQLAREELEKAVELVEVPPCLGNERDRVLARLLEGANLELQPVTEALHAPEHADGCARSAATVEQLDVLPHSRVDPAAPVDELEREIRRSGARPQTLLACHGEDTLDHPVLGQLGDPSCVRQGDGRRPIRRCSLRPALNGVTGWITHYSRRPTPVGVTHRATHSPQSRLLDGW